jgi:biopolymer transport protein ExbD
MSMSVGETEEGAPMMDMNTTPLIDVMLVLLVMIIITIPVMTHAVKLDMPRPSAAPPPEQMVDPEIIRLEVDFDGTVLWNGTTVPNIDQLERYFQVEAAKDPQPELHLRPHRRAKYDTVAQVLAVAQRNGIQRIGFVGNEQFMDE